ncbi:SMI1/KNR4 family protein [Novosphingobium sp. RL4]|uniref:SMI1/KNR4 family protein n=1 Tax=Novosphingobium sp. RL4 TaxID=3109595 RepID=UPI002D782033|nr:SMI1/KNR4 family protein [Novosphingobium sp. RL4]WRT94960.1 SMI1/KNR4 family protein [Novosphingobium sp. RL4]
MLETRNWFAKQPASEGELAEIRHALPTTLPLAYFDLLAETNGGEGPLPVNPYTFCLDPVVTVLDAFRSRNYDRPDLDGFLVFGGDGSRELIAFDMRSGLPGAIVTIDIVVGPESAEIVASNFDQFVSMLGHSSEDYRRL